MAVIALLHSAEVTKQFDAFHCSPCSSERCLQRDRLCFTLRCYSLSALHTVHEARHLTAVAQTVRC
jgi:hypothetical protein